MPKTKKETRGRKKLSPDEKKKVVRLLFTGAEIKCAGGEEKLKEKIYSCNFCNNGQDSANKNFAIPKFNAMQPDRQLKTLKKLNDKK